MLPKARYPGSLARCRPQHLAVPHKDAGKRMKAAESIGRTPPFLAIARGSTTRSRGSFLSVWAGGIFDGCQRGVWRVYEPAGGKVLGRPHRSKVVVGERTCIMPTLFLPIIHMREEDTQHEAQSQYRHNTPTQNRPKERQERKTKTRKERSNAGQGAGGRRRVANLGGGEKRGRGPWAFA